MHELTASHRPHRRVLLSARLRHRLLVALRRQDRRRRQRRGDGREPAFFVGCATGIGGAAVYHAPLSILKLAPSLRLFTPEQVQGLAYLFARLSNQAGNTSLVFFGCYCLLIGGLVFRSGFLPRAVGTPEPFDVLHVTQPRPTVLVRPLG